MKALLMKDGVQIGVVDFGRCVAYGDADWVDPEAPDFRERSAPNTTYELKPITRKETSGEPQD